MAENALTTRRHFLKSAPVAAAAMALPAVEAASCSEHPQERIRRLAAELADAMNDFQMGKGWHVRVHPSKASKFPVYFINSAASPESQIHEINHLMSQMPPMQRLFMKQRLYDYRDGINWFDGTVTPDQFWGEVYDEWKSGFHPDLIKYIETSGKF